MGNKYIIEGAAFNGDGTSSAEATSNGGVGAWNTITYFEGVTPAYGSIAAGDTVYIRSKTAVGADITRTLAANVTLGSNVATSSGQITWVIDGGSVWAGISGVVRYQCPSTFVLLFQNYNSVVGENADSIQAVETNVSANQKNTITFNSAGYYKNWLVDLTAATGSLGARASIGGLGYGAQPVLENIHWVASNWHSQLIGSGRSLTPILINPDFELLAVESVYPVFLVNGESAAIEIYGGRVRGPGATTGQTLANINNAYAKGVKAINFQWPRAMTTITATPTTTSMNGTFDAIGADGGAGAVQVSYWGEMSSRVDNNPPRLNAVLPDSGQTGWAWLIKNYASSPTKPAKFALGKYYTQDAAQKTLTVEMLVSTQNVSANKSSLWISVTYIDQDGNTVGINTQDTSGTVLDASTASWSATTWGPISFDKRKLSITTQTPIKKDTMVSVVVTLSYAQANADDILFVCPDVTIS